MTVTRHLMSALFGLSVVLGSLATQAADAVPKAIVEAKSFIVIYRPGENWPHGKKLSELPLKDHGKYMLELFRRGVMKMAGGFADDSGGAVLINAASIHEAMACAEADPAVIEKIFAYELHEWRVVPWEKFLKAQDAN